MKNRFIFSVIFSFFVLSTVLYAKQDEIYFLPQQSKVLEQKIMDLLESSKKSIVISMYNFSYKKFAKSLVKAKKQGLKIKVYLDKEKVKKDDEIYKYLKKYNIKIYLSKEKLHTKLAIFDDKILMMGSTNWTKKSFLQNNEVVLFLRNKTFIEQTKSFLDTL